MSIFDMGLTHENLKKLCDAIDEQADEIERLREALRTIAMSHLEKDDRNSGWGYCISIARSALQQKESE